MEVLFTITVLLTMVKLTARASLIASALLGSGNGIAAMEPLEGKASPVKTELVCAGLSGAAAG